MPAHAAPRGGGHALVDEAGLDLVIARAHDGGTHGSAVLGRNPGLEERPADRVVGGDAHHRRRLAVHERHLAVAVEREDEHVGHVDEIAIALLQLLTLALELHLAERLLDDRDELLGAERLEDEMRKL